MRESGEGFSSPLIDSLGSLSPLAVTRCDEAPAAVALLPAPWPPCGVAVKGWLFRDNRTVALALPCGLIWGGMQFSEMTLCVGLKGLRAAWGLLGNWRYFLSSPQSSLFLENQCIYQRVRAVISWRCTFILSRAVLGASTDSEKERVEMTGFPCLSGCWIEGKHLSDSGFGGCVLTWRGRNWCY